MTSLLDHRLVVVTGKGGVGKTTVAAALGILGARRGLRTIVVEVGEQHRVADLYGRAGNHYEELELEPRLWSISIDPQRALLEWIETQVLGRVPARILGSSNTFQYFVAAAPGAREVLTMGKVWDLAQARRWRPGSPGYDLVVLDGPATGHALALLRSPRTFAAIARVGPVAQQANRISEFLADTTLSSYLGVAQASEMAVAETIELQERLHEELGRRLHAVVVNDVLARRFSADDLARVEQATGPEVVGARRAGDRPLLSAAARATRFAQRQATSQRAQIARLRHHELDVSSVAVVFEAELGLAEVRGIADALEKRLG